MNSPFYSQAAGMVWRKINARRRGRSQLRISRNGDQEAETHGKLIEDTVIDGDRNSTYAAPFIGESL